MKKKILSQMMILSFAFAGLFLVGNNVFGGDPSVIITDPGDDPGAGSGCTSETICNQGFGDFGLHSGEILCCQTARYRGNARN